MTVVDPGGGSITGKRLGWVDRLRGLAIVLMVIDHALRQVDPGSPWRMTVSRAGLPLFMFASAAVWKGRPSRRRVVELVAVVIVEAVLVSRLGMTAPAIVAVFGLVVVALVVFPELADQPLYGATLGLVQALYWPIEHAWTGYQPGLVLAWWCIGRMGADQLVPVAVRLPRWLELVGRRPLTWYVGHLVALVVVVEAVGL